MNKIRIIPSILYKDNTAIRGKNFESWRTVGSLMQSIRLYSLREVDELIFLDVNATEKKFINFNLIDDFADECFMPIIIGGGIKSFSDIENLLKVGADRVCVNSANFYEKNFVGKSIKYFGSQCLVLSVDYKNINNKKFVFVNSGKKNTGIELEEYLKKAEDIGIGEVLLTSIDHDGLMDGCDNQTLLQVNKKFSFNIIGSGGIGSEEHALQTLNETEINALSCSSIFHFTENTPLSLKKFLKKNQLNVRI